LINFNGIFGIGLVLGLIGWCLHLFFIIISATSKKRWTVLIDYNQYKEAKAEVILIIVFIVFFIYLIIIF
jgi:hypothetical protein